MTQQAIHKPLRYNLYIANKKNQLQFQNFPPNIWLFLRELKTWPRNKRILIIPKMLLIFKPREVHPRGLSGLNLPM